MLTQLKALFVVFAASAATLIFFYRPYSKLVGEKRYIAWAIAWLATLTTVFLAPQYWLFAALFAIVIVAFSLNEPNKPAIFMLLVVAAPAVGLSIPGFLGINRFIQTTPQSFLIVFLLLPSLFVARRMKTNEPTGRTADFFFLCWMLLQVALAMRAPTFTHILRVSIESLLAFAPIYYALSRTPKSLEDLRALTAAFVLAVIILSIVTIPETFMTWHFYTTAAEKWVDGIDFAYKLRSGALRATASSSNPIVWGFIAMCGLGLALAVLNERLSPLIKLAGFSALSVGVITSLSRGPWIGAAVMVLIFIATGRRKAGHLMLYATGAGIAASVAALTPYGQRIIDLLPFVGGNASDTISYRQQLLERSLAVFAERPVFGAQDYLEHPELQALRQGEGIIDIVNSYLQVALQSGLVGLAIYLGVFMSTLAGVRKAMRSAQRYDAEMALYCRAYFATLVGVMLTLFTTSTVQHMSYIVWALIGGGVALARIERNRREQPAENIDAPQPIENTSPQFDWK